MKLSTKTTYGLKAIIYLAKNKDKSISLSEIATNEGISVKYLEAIFATLKKAELIKSARGASGGYTLASPAAKISLAQIFGALEGKKALASCSSNHKTKVCSFSCHCGVSKVTEKLNQAIDQTLLKIKLKDLI